MKYMSRYTLVGAVTCVLVLSACEPYVGDRGTDGDRRGGIKGSTTRLVLNDTGVDFYQQHMVADSPYEIIPASPIKGSAAAPGQDADSGRDVSDANPADGKGGFSFTKLDGATGAELPDDAQVWGCVRDNVTNLIWETKTVSGEHDAGHMYTWYEPDATKNGGDPGMAAVEGDCAGIKFLKGNTNEFISKVNNFEKLCGFSDWRLPKREEFRSLIDYGVELNWYIDGGGVLRYENAVYIDEKYFPNLHMRRHRWTAETSYYNPAQAWSIHPNDGKSEVHSKACSSNGQGFTNGIMLVRSPN
ncbi:MAG: DUF1566 domain-containing protein [Gammaproteobacteria bacterium]|nr:DUF1566 domain-containing protein [Gammaproteobacteria bacterium]